LPRRVSSFALCRQSAGTLLANQHAFCLFLTNTQTSLAKPAPFDSTTKKLTELRGGPRTLFFLAPRSRADAANFSCEAASASYERLKNYPTKTRLPRRVSSFALCRQSAGTLLANQRAFCLFLTNTQSSLGKPAPFDRKMTLVGVSPTTISDIVWFRAVPTVTGHQLFREDVPGCSLSRRDCRGPRPRQVGA
jgi:hypothetical protein